ncbi:MAG: hypothetical protein M3280_06070 [Actinomycetota bacterium]|nr:hypothetical protein [Actinomycetota bacterium]
MSGSPVYVGDELVGAVSHSLASGPSTVAGLTAAKDLFALLDYPVGESSAESAGDGAEVGPAMADSIEGATGEEVAESESFEVLRVPLSASGLGASAMNRLSSTLDREDAPLFAYPGSSARLGGPVPSATVGAGDSFAAALSYGDITFASIGTTALVCDDKAVAFGHLLDFTGKTELGANAARALAIVEDEQNGPYKLAKVKDLAGLVDQDRMAGLRALLDRAPVPIPVNSKMTSLETGITRFGRSSAVLDTILPPVGFYHFLGNADSVYDQIAGGSSKIFFRIVGQADGEEFVLGRHNVYSSHEDIALASARELERYLWTLVSQPFAEVDFTKVRMIGAFDEDRDDYKITKALVSRNGGPYRDVREMRAEPGDDLGIRVTLRRLDGTTFTVDMELQIPPDTRRFAYITIAGASRFGDDDLSCFFDADICRVRFPRSVDSFQEVIRFLRHRPKNNVVRASLITGRRGQVVDEDRAELDKPVLGSDFIRLDLPGRSGERSIAER